MTVDVTLLDWPSVSASPFEIVERKGLGHPDTICDALAETFSAGLSRYYLDRFGTVLHHNVDKALLCGGAARTQFGGGELTAPIEIHLAGRATSEYGGVKVPVDEIAIESCRRWLYDNLTNLDAVHDVRIFPHIRPTSPDLAGLFARGHSSGATLANDTSFGVGFAPLDTLETIVLATERALNGSEIRRQHAEIGADIKVMGARHDDAIVLTVACAFVSRHVVSLADYVEKRTHIAALALRAARAVADAPITVAVNAADRDTPDSIYLTVTGLSAESGDDGQVGRGNRVNGLITPYRPMSLEAAAGKNSVTHVGKLYNVVANRIAQAVADEILGVDEAYCYLLSRIGDPISRPHLFDVKVRLSDPHQLDILRPQIVDVANAEFGRIDTVWRDAVAGTLRLW